LKGVRLEQHFVAIRCRDFESGLVKARCTSELGMVEELCGLSVLGEDIEKQGSTYFE